MKTPRSREARAAWQEAIAYLHDAEDARATGGRWRCTECGVQQVQIGLPGWFHEAKDGELFLADVDMEADIAWWYCENCGHTESGRPAEADETEAGA